MMRQFELVERVQRYNPKTDEALLNRAYVFAMQAHGSQKRASGDPYFTHPLEVAALLTDLHVDDITIIAALLHDVVEDTGVSLEQIEQNFGKDVARVVDGLTKLNRLELVSVEAKQAENLRKLLVAVAQDLRVLLIKFADRLHNMRTLSHMRPDKRRRIAAETIEIYAPLAGRMGMQDLKEELEEICFGILFPEAKAMIESRLEIVKTKNSALIDDIIEELKTIISAKGISAEIYGRQKRPYSIWKKMERKQLAFEQLSDIYAFRVVVDSVEDCYVALGAIHTTWRTVPGRFKDFISNPKANDYQSIHTTIIGPERQRAELQVRTRKMHDIAEYGIAAHVLYKDGIVDDKALLNESRAYAWLRHMVEQLSQGDAPEEFLENAKLEFFSDQVYCFTPRGRVISLPSGATPIDFAYAVHTDLGNQCIGCKINGIMMPISTQLSNGDEVDIMQAKGHVPPAAWENLAATGKARSAIRRANRLAIRSQYSGLGRQIVQRAFEKNAKTFSDDRIQAVLPKLARDHVDEVFACVGRGEILARDVLKAVYPDYVEVYGVDSSGQTIQRRKDVYDDANTKAYPVRGGKGQPIRFCEGGALPGERIVGIATPQQGIVIYPIDSKDLQNFDSEPERWVDVRWDDDVVGKIRFPSTIKVNAMNEPGALASIALVIAEAQGNIDRVKLIERHGDLSELIIDIEVFNLSHLNDILAQLRTKPLVVDAQRSR